MLANILDKEGAQHEAERIYRQLYNLQLENLGGDHPDTLRNMHNLARALAQQKKYEESLPLAQAAFAGKREILGADHEDTFNSMNLLGTCLKNLGKYEEAEKLFSHALAMAPASDRLVAQLTNNLGEVLRQMGRYQEGRGHPERGHCQRFPHSGPARQLTLYAGPGTVGPQAIPSSLYSF